MHINHKSIITVTVIMVTMALIVFSFFSGVEISGFGLVGALGVVLYGAYCFVAFVREWPMFAGTVPLDAEVGNKGWRIAALVVGVVFYAIGIKFLYNI